MSLRHGLRDEITAHLAGHASRDGGLKKEPNVSPVAGPGPFHRERHISGPTGRGEGCDIVAPPALVKVHGKERAGLVFQHRVYADCVTAPEVLVDGLLRDGNERLVRAFTTLHARLVAYTAHPLVGASRSVTLRTLLGIDPAPWVNVRATAEHLEKQRDLLFRCGRR